MGDQQKFESSCGATGILEMIMYANDRITAIKMTRGVYRGEKKHNVCLRSSTVLLTRPLSMLSSQNCCIFMADVVTTFAQRVVAVFHPTMQ